MVLKIDNNGDWEVGGYLTGQAEIRQNIITRVKSWKRDWFLDTEANIDWLNILQSTNIRARETIRQEVQRVTLQTEGVLSVEEISYEFDNVTRTLTMSIQYTDVYGQTSLNLEVADDNN